MIGIAPAACLTANFTEGERNGTIVEEHADVAQLVEQLIRNQQVIGSSPIVGSRISEDGGF